MQWKSTKLHTNSYKWKESNKAPNGVPYLFPFPQRNGAHVQISWHYQSCLQNTNANGELLLDMPRYCKYSYSAL